MKKLRPLSDNILVELPDDQEKTVSGIYIPDSAKEKTKKGKVVEVGKGKVDEKGNRISIDVKPGEVIWFDKYFSENDIIKINGKSHLIVKQDEVICVEE